MTLAQKQMTQFENDSTQSPNNLKYLGIVNDKIIFTAFTPEEGNELWVSDGTTGGTKLLKDITEGANFGNIHSFVVNGKWSYFIYNNAIWKTDGTTENTTKIADGAKEINEYFVKIVLFDNKVLATGNYYSSMDFQNLYWINEDFKLEKFKDAISSYNIANNSIYYVKYDKIDNSTRLFYDDLKDFKELFKTNDKTYPNTSEINFLFSFVQDEGTYSLISTMKSGMKLIRFTLQKTIVYDWGNHPTTVPLITKDNNGNTILFKTISQNNTSNLQIYKPQADSLVLIDQIAGNGITDSYSFTGGTKFFSNVLFQNEKMVYVNGFVIYSTRVCYFNEFNLKNKTFEKKSIPIIHQISYGNFSISALSDSTYKMENEYLSFLYNAKTNTNSDVKTFQPIQQKTINFVNNKTYEITNQNLFEINNSSKTPLIKTKQIFTRNGSIITQFFEDKQYVIFTKYNTKNTYELWVFDNQKAQKIYSGSGYPQKFFTAKNISKNLLFDVKDGTDYTIFEIDYAKNRAMLKHSIKFDGSSIYLTANDNYIVIPKYSNNQTIHIIISKDKTIEVPPSSNSIIYFTTNNLYLVKYEEIISISSNNPNVKEVIRNIYRIVDGESKFIIETGLASSIVPFGNRLYYLGKDKTLSYLDENDDVIKIADGVYGFYHNTQSNQLNYTIVPSLSSTIYENQVFDLNLEKVVYSKLVQKFESSNGYLNEDGKVVTLYKNDLYIFDGKEQFNVRVENLFNPNFRIYRDGVTMTYSTIPDKFNNAVGYFDFNERKFIKIIDGIDNLSLMFHPQNDFVIIRRFLANNSLEYYVWNYKTRVLKKIETNAGEYMRESTVGNFANSNNQLGDYFTWVFQNDELVRNGEHPPKNIADIKLKDIVNYTTKYSPEKGNELYAYGNDFAINFPEIVKGAEGITLGSTFVFNNEIYIYAFTSTYGWQIWKMYESNSILSSESNTDEIVNVSIFPNPTTDFVNLDSQKNYSFSLFDLKGKELLKGDTASTKTLNFENYASGVYLILFYDEKRHFVKRIIKY
jgi:ELWxxDGT repeat protein